jgi:hypothetical protein
MRSPDFETSPETELAPGTVNLHLGAVRRLAYEAADVLPRATE